MVKVERLAPFEPVVSPLTHTSEVTHLRTWPAAQLIAEWRTAWGIDVAVDLQAYDAISLYRCDRTQLLFFTPDCAGSGGLYEQLMRFEWYYMADKWEYAVALADLQPLLRQPAARILEIGAGQGAFVQRAIAAGFAIEGLELNAQAIAQAQAQNLPIRAMDLYALAAAAAADPTQRYDAICSFQVLEHVPQPRTFLAAALDLLNPGGHLMVCVPNANSFMKYQYNLLDMPPHHLHRWSAATFRALPQVLPLRLAHLRTEPLAPYHVRDCLNAYQQHYQSSALGRRVFSDRTLPLYEKILQHGGRRWVLGQSLYAHFRKVSP
jgi:SAM-dependent methyltransferase